MITTIVTTLSHLTQNPFVSYAFITLLAIFVISQFIQKFKSIAKANQHKKNAKKKRAERDQQAREFNLPDLNISDDLRQKILNADATTLLDMLKSATVSSEQIMTVYIKRIQTIGLTNDLITEINFKEALTQAKKCDELRKENPTACKGTLFGVPISLKDMFVLKNTDASCGLASRLYNPAKDDGYIVKILKLEGAIPFVKSNVPQAILFPHTNNHIWGCAKNPWDKERSAGGSSGGEAGLIASRCSPLGLGNDLAGSIRIPAFFCGVVGFKPTAGRLTSAGTTELSATADHLQYLKLTAGPITKSAQDVNLIMKALLSDQSHNKIPLSEQESHYVRIPWDESKVNQKCKGLRVGYFKSMEYFPASLANQRAVEEAVKALKRKGHDVVEVNFPNITNIFTMVAKCLYGDGEARFLKDTLEGENAIDVYTLLMILTSMPKPLKSLLRGLLNILGEKRGAQMIDLTQRLSAYDSAKLAEKQTKERKEFVRIWEENKLDALISPGLATPAVKTAHMKDIVGLVCYSNVFNALDMPTGALPVTVVKEGEDNYSKELSKHQDMVYRKTAESMKGTVGLPVGVQITTLPWQEEKCVNIMIELEEEIQFRKHYPYPV